jgi:hypothetical protein
MDCLIHFRRPWYNCQYATPSLIREDVPVSAIISTLADFFGVSGQKVTLVHQGRILPQATLAGSLKTTPSKPVLVVGCCPSGPPTQQVAIPPPPTAREMGSDPPVSDRSPGQGEVDRTADQKQMAVPTQEKSSESTAKGNPSSAEIEAAFRDLGEITPAARRGLLALVAQGYDPESVVAAFVVADYCLDEATFMLTDQGSDS